MSNATEINIQVRNGDIQFMTKVHQDNIAGQDTADVAVLPADFENVILLQYATKAEYITALDAAAVAAGFSGGDATSLAGALGNYTWALVFDYAALVTQEDTSGSTP